MTTRQRLSRQTEASFRARPLEVPLLLIGVRCVARYILLPFALPLLGVGAGATPGTVTRGALAILLVLDLLAIAAMIATLRWLWRARHPRRWQYLALALVLTALIALLFANDVRVLSAQPGG